MYGYDKYFLESSYNSVNMITKLFDFVWPTSISLWNLQWQVKGFVQQFYEQTTRKPNVQELNSRFVLGSGLQSVNLHQLENKQWSEMQRWFARIILAETCSLFEGWIKSAYAELDVEKHVPNSDWLIKSLQFPTKYDANGIPVKGVKCAINKLIGATGALPVARCFKPTMLEKNKKNSIDFIDNLLICYRAFKEVRNDFTHHGGNASAGAYNSYLEYRPYLETPEKLGLKESPIFHEIDKGKQIELSLRGVVGLGEVVLRLISTIDYMLVESSLTENIIKKRWKEKHGGMTSVKKDIRGRGNQLVKLIRQCNLPTPTDVNYLYSYLASEKLVGLHN